MRVQKIREECMHVLFIRVHMCVVHDIVHVRLVW